MRRLTNTTALMAIMLIVGCAQTPAGRWFQARDTLSTAQDLTVIAYDAGKIDDSEMVQIVKPVSLGAQAALDKAELHLPEGGEAFNAFMSMVESFLVELERLYIAEGSTPQ